MADGIFTFTSQFNEFLPIYQNVARMWIGDGINTGTAGMLYVGYEDGTTAELGSVSLYATAVENGYEGTERDWLLTIMSISDLVKGSEVEISYLVSESGTEHPDPEEEWSETPVFERGKFTWTKLDMKWIDRTTTTIYFVAYQGENGQVEAVNGSTGQIVIHGENLPIGESNNQSIKDYIDEKVIPETATDDDIDAMFSMVFFSGAAFLTGRRFEEGDSITYKIEAVTQGAPMPQENTTTIYPTGGNSWRYRFGYVVYELSDIPEGETSKTFQYRITEHAHTLNGVPANPTVHLASVTITDNGNGTLKITKSENFNAMYFAYAYSANGRITFEGNIKLDGRSMAAREFMVQIKEGNEIVADNVSTISSVASGVFAPISFPPINYTLDDIGTHVYTVKQTSVSGEGVTIASTVYTVTVQVTDIIRDGVLEIETNGTDRNLNFVNTYEATGSIVLSGTETLIHRLFRATDTLSISLTGNGKLPSPAVKVVDFTVGEPSADFSFPRIDYTLADMRNEHDGYDDVKTFVYAATEISGIPGVTLDGKIHNVTVRVTDNKRGSLLVDAIYNDGNKFDFTGTYNAYGTMIFLGEKRLVNRNFVPADSMYVMISSNNGKLPYVSSMNVPLNVGYNVTSFNFVEVTYELSDIGYNASRTFNYIVTEDTIIRGATNDLLVHSVDVYVEDNYDGTLNIVPTYSDGNKVSFESIYDATGFVALSGLKTIVNRTFKSGDTMSVAVTSLDGKLPSPASITVPLVADSSSASFSFAQITYKITDLGGLSTKTFNYTLTETITMPGTTPASISDTVSVAVTDNYDGTLNVVPTYTQGNRATFTNVYSAAGDLSFKARCVFTNGNMNTNPFSIRITQVSGNNSTTQASTNVVLPSPVTQVANTGNTQDVEFNNVVHFVKNSLKDDTQATYWFMVEEVLPNVDAQGIYSHVKYDTHKKWINVSVTDHFDGTLIVAKSPAADISSGLDDRFVNEQLADLTIAKSWTGDSDRLTAAEKSGFTINVSGPSSYSASFTYAQMVNDSYTLADLSLGEYVVTETNNTVENFSIATSYSVSGTSTNRVNLISGGSSITVIDNANRLEGTLNIVKAWAGDHSVLTAQQKNAVTFTVTGPKQKSTDASAFSETFTYADMTNGRMTFEHLTLGTYAVSESNYEVQYFDVDVSYSVDGSSTNNTVIADADNKTITVTDNYTQHVGSVRVTKRFTGITSAQKPVNFTITNDYNDSVFDYTNADNASTADGVTTPYEWTIANVPVLTHVEFTEHNANVTDYTLEASAIPVDYISSAVVRYQTSVVAITNNYILHVGTVKVTKQFSGITSAQKPVNFSITNNYNESVFTYNNANNNGVADGVNTPYEWTISNVPVHTAITFTEHNADITDYTLTASAVPQDYTNVGVVKDSTSTVALSNAYTLHTGSVKVTKTFSGITAAQKPANFNITNDYNNNVFTYVNADNVNVDGINTAYEWTITNVPVHTTIQFTENNADIADYTLTLTASPANRTCSAVVKDQTSVVDLTNSYVQHVGTVKVTKQFAGITSSQKPVSFAITNNYSNDIFNYNNADNALSADGINTPYEWTIANVPVHTTIQFTESNTDVTNYTLTPVAVPANYTCTAVTKDQTSTVVITNSYEQDVGTVKVTKLFEGITLAEKPSTFQIANDYNGTLFAYDNADNTSTADGINTAYEWTIANVPVGTVITFTESNTALNDYNMTSVTSKSCIAVTKNNTSTVNFVNTYVKKTGSVKVTKSFSGIGSGDLPEDFRITNDYDNSIFVYANADNAATADGVNTAYEWTIANVPVGTTVEFTESNTSVTGYTLDGSVQTTITSSAVVYNTTTTVSFTNSYNPV